jgi:hypothetical protein
MFIHREIQKDGKEFTIAFPGWYCDKCRSFLNQEEPYGPLRKEFKWNFCPFCGSKK